MQIACPACDARYDVPDARLAPGKRVRCARCGDSWTPMEPEPEPEPELLPRTEPEPVASIFAASPLTTKPARRAPDGRLLWVGWAATAFVVVAVVVAAVAFRAPIQAAWPPSQRLYDLF